jgi:hypothetical protein
MISPASQLLNGASRRLLTVLAAASVIFLMGARGWALDCSWVTPIVSIQDEAQQATSPVVRSSLLMQEERVSKQVAVSMFQNYLEKGLGDALKPECLARLEEPGGFLHHLQSAFFAQSLRAFRQARGSRIRTLVELLGSRASKENSIPFRMSGEHFDASPTEHKAGFHRATGAVFMDIARIDPGEWLLILTHELIHDVDSIVPIAVQKYSNVELAKHLIERAAKSSDPASLPADEHRAYKDWIEAGMDRGLLAEVRAWAITILIYEDGLREGLWQRIAWLDDVMAKREPSESWERFSLRFLSERSEQPREGVFVHELARNLLEEVKGELLRGERPLEFGELAQLLAL